MHFQISPADIERGDSSTPANYRRSNSAIGRRLPRTRCIFPTEQTKTWTLSPLARNARENAFRRYEVTRSTPDLNSINQCGSLTILVVNKGDDSEDGEPETASLMIYFHICNAITHFRVQRHRFSAGHHSYALDSIIDIIATNSAQITTYVRKTRINWWTQHRFLSRQWHEHLISLATAWPCTLMRSLRKISSLSHKNLFTLS